MEYLASFFSKRLLNVDFAQPLSLLDLFVTLLFIACFLVYLHRFPVFRVVLGVLFLFICSTIFSLAGLKITALLFWSASFLILISLPLIFAPEVRHYLEKLGRLSFLHIPRFTQNQKTTEFIRNLVDTCFELAERKIGATLVLQRKTGLGQTLDTGVIIDARFGSKLLQNIFFPKSPLHDGAVVIKDGRIVAAACLLPVLGEIKLDPPFGTRHRAGLSVTKDTDAVAIMVSEERGQVSLAENGKLLIDLDRAQLSEKLNQLLIR